MKDKSIGEKIKLRRINLGMTLKDLSLKCDISPQLISDYENNRKEPGTKNLLQLCNSLNLSSNYVLGINNHSNQIDDKGVVLEYCINILESRNDFKLIINEKENSRDVYIQINDGLIKNTLYVLKNFINLTDDFSVLTKKALINMVSSLSENNKEE